MFKSFFVSIVLIGSVSGAFAADNTTAKPFSYRVEIPAGQLTCDQEAQALGNRFANATGLTVSSSVCQATQQIEKLDVHFGCELSRESRSEAVQSELHERRNLLELRRLLGSVSAQATTFEANTGLKVLASRLHCC